MNIEIMGERKEKDWSFTVIKKELLEIKDKDITFVDANSDITYWLSWGAFYERFKDKDSENNIVFFTHPNLFWTSAIEKANHSIFMCKRYYDEASSSNKSLIHLGVHMNHFKPKIKIGIIAWRNRRKNSDFLYDFFRSTDLENFSFHINGPKWQDIVLKFQKYVDLTYTERTPYDDLPALYQSFDYLLITSTLEGGPLPLIEAYACGIPVISTDVGLVGELDVIGFSGIDGLRKVLYDIQSKYRDRVKQFTWDNFREKHTKLFKQFYENS